MVAYRNHVLICRLKRRLPAVGLVAVTEPKVAPLGAHSLASVLGFS